MEHHSYSADEHHPHPREYRFVLLIAISILIAASLVFIALRLYVSSGASQLDLSRPGYEGIREQARGATGFNGYEREGEVTSSSLEDFKKLYDERLQNVVAVDAYDKDVLSPESLKIDQKSAEVKTP